MITKKTSVAFSIATALIALMLLFGGQGPNPPKPDAGGFEWGLTTPSASAPARGPAAPVA